MNNSENTENKAVEENRITKSAHLSNENDEARETQENGSPPEPDKKEPHIETGEDQEQPNSDEEPLKAIVVEESDQYDDTDDFFELISPEDDEEDVELEPEDQEKETLLDESRNIIQKLEDELEKKSNEAQENFERLVRLQAEFENFKKRTYKEKQEFKKYCLESIMLELIPNLDNLDRGLQSAHQGQDLSKIIEGLEMIQRGFFTSLNKFGMKRIETKDQLFDPAKHEAMMIVDTTEHKNNMIIEEFQKGYYLNDRVIKPALVSVARHIAAVKQEDEEPEDQISSAIEEISLKLKKSKDQPSDDEAGNTPPGETNEG